MFLELGDYQQRYRDTRLSPFATGKVEQKQSLWELTKNTNKNLSTEASSRRICPVCVDLGTVEGKYGLYTEDIDDYRGRSLRRQSWRKAKETGQVWGKLKSVIF